MKISDIIIEYLKHFNIDRVFGVPGGVIEPLLNAISNSNIKPVNFASENQSCFVSQSYGEAKNSFGVCFSIWGAGETNMINAVSNAYIANKKLLVIVGSGNQKTETLSPAQDNTTSGINSQAIFDNITVYNEKITNKDHFSDKLRKALIKMHIHNKPVRIEIPKNIMEEEIDFNIDNIKIDIPNTPVAHPKDIDYILNLIKNKNINFFIGSNGEKIKEKISKISYFFSHNIYETPTGKGIINKNHPFYQGVFGISGTHNQKPLNRESFNIFIGDTLNEENTNGWSEILFNNFIYINDSISNSESPLNIHNNVLTDINYFFEEIEKKLNLDNKKTPKFTIKEETINTINSDTITPKELVETMSTISTNKTVSFFDIGNSFLWGIKYWKGKEHIDNVQNFKIGTGLSTMGWALGSSIGYSLAKNDDLVFCFIGDGSLLMCSNEIMMLSQNKQKMVFIILNDGLLGTVFHGQKMSKSASICNEIPKVNFKVFFESNGIKSYTIKSQKELLEIKEDIINTEEVIVLDVHIDKSISPPLKQRLKNLQ